MADSVEASTWHLEDIEQDRGVFRALSDDQLRDVEELRLLNPVMGAQVHLELAYDLHISVPSTPTRAVFEDGKSNVFLSSGSYASAQEPPNSFKDGVLGTLLGAVLSKVKELHLLVQDLHRRMETKGWSVYADDPASAKAEQVDIQHFHNALPASLREGLGLVLDHNVETVLEKRGEVLRKEGRSEPDWSVWGNFGKQTLTKVLVKSSREFGKTRVQMNHPQGMIDPNL